MIRRVVFAVIALGLFVLPIIGLVGVAQAGEAKKETAKTETKPQDISQSVVQSFIVEKPIQPGIIVRVDDTKANIMTADQKSSDSVLGVIISANDSPLTITQAEATKQQAFVATSGRYSVLVTNQNGAVVPGDFIVISAVAGIGMKADNEQPIVVGTAVTGFNGTKEVVGKVKLKDSTGKSQEVAIGRVTVAMDIGKNPLRSDSKRDNVPDFLTKTAQLVANKPVSAARIYVGITTIIAASFVSAVVVYSGVRSGMVAVGRNPLSKKSIIKSLIQTILAGVTIFIVGVIAVYLLLKL